MRTISLNARTAAASASSPEIEIALLCIEHAGLDAPLRLSTDPTERLSIAPLAYGTRSRWMGADPSADPYLFVALSAELPSDLEDAPASARLVMANLDARIAETLRSFVDRPTVHLAVVLASSPDTPELEFLDMRIMSAEGDANQISIEISRAPIEEESVPKDRFTKSRFPGLFR